jgi:hypothetical protein
MESASLGKPSFKFLSLMEANFWMLSQLSLILKETKCYLWLREREMNVGRANVFLPKGTMVLPRPVFRQLLNPHQEEEMVVAEAVGEEEAVEEEEIVDAEEEAQEDNHSSSK